MSPKLHTVKEVHDTLGFTGSKEMTQAALEELVRESRCFRQFGAVVRMTDADIMAFLAWTSPRAIPGSDPSDKDDGQIVAIGESLDRNALVYLTWTVRGQECAELDRVQVGCPEPLTILTVWDAPFGDYKALTKDLGEKKLKYGKGGNWWVARVRDELRDRMSNGDDAT